MRVEKTIKFVDFISLILLFRFIFFKLKFLKVLVVNLSKKSRALNKWWWKFICSSRGLSHSTETALMKVRNDITMAIDTGQSAMLVLLDLSAAFDTVEVDTLIHTLQDHFGVTGSALDWFRSYMIDRYFQVKVKGTSSKWIKLQYGVPQRSVLGPLLFSL